MLTTNGLLLRNSRAVFGLGGSFFGVVVCLALEPPGPLRLSVLPRATAAVSKWSEVERRSPEAVLGRCFACDLSFATAESLEDGKMFLIGWAPLEENFKSCVLPR